MSRFGKLPIVPLALLALVCFLASAARAVPQAEPDQPINLSLKKAPLPTVLESFARISGGELDIDPEIDGTVTVDLESVPWRAALGQICRTHRISCYWSEGPASGSEPSRLVVRPSDGFAGMAESIDMELRKAPIGIVLQAMDSITGKTFRVEVDPALDGVVDVQLSSTPWPEALKSICRPSRCQLTWAPDSVLVQPFEGNIPSSGAAWKVSVDAPELEHLVVELLDGAGPDQPPFAELDALCQEAGCDWTVRWAETPRLEITAGEAEPPASEPRFGVEPVALEASVSSGGLRTTRAFAFGWDSPSHRLEPAEASGVPAIRLTWIAFSPGRQILLAYGIRCDDPGSGRYDLLPPIPLPLAETWKTSVGKARLDIRPAESPSNEGPNTAPLCADEPATFRMSLRTDTRPPSPGVPGLPTKPGNFLMVTPKGEPGPAAALVYLGPNADGSKAVALVQPAEDGEVSISMERFDLAPGETWSRSVVSDDSGMRMYVTALTTTASTHGVD